MIRQLVIIKFLVDFFQRYFLPRVKIENYNSEIDERNFYDRPINDSIKQHEEVRKISTGQGDAYKTGCLLDFASFEKNQRLIAADLSKQKALDADSRAIKQIIFTEKIKSTAANTKEYFTTFSNNQDKQYYNSLKEQQKFCNQYKWLNTVKQMLNYQINN